jgi:hypothetical protein
MIRDQFANHNNFMAALSIPAQNIKDSSENEIRTDFVVS